jgi:hypothetical protein
LEEERRKNRNVIFELENGNEYYNDVLEVETNFVTETMGKGQRPILEKFTLCEKEVNFMVFIPCIIDG